jgi:hypothetical protein
LETRSNPNKTVTIYLGELKHLQFKQQYHMRGDGLLSYIFNGHWISDYSSKAKKVLQEYGNKTIESLTINRKPIREMIDQGLNVFSLGKWKKLKAKYGYDKFFHLSLVADVGNENIIVEKNEIINIALQQNNTKAPEGETIKVDMKNKKLTLNEMMENTRQVLKNRRYFSYDAFDNNCQMFIRSILQENGLYTQSIDKFLFQDVTAIKQELGILPKIAKTITDVAAAVSDAVN